MAKGAEVTFRPVPVQTRQGRGLHIRQFALADFKTLVQMYKTFEPKRVAQGLPPPDVPRIARWLDQLAPKSLAVLALAEDKVVAHSLLCPMTADSAEFTIFVHQDYREEGLGTI